MSRFNVLTALVVCSIGVTACGPSALKLQGQATPAGSPVRCGLDISPSGKVRHIGCKVEQPGFELTDVVLNGGTCASPFDEDSSLSDVDDDPTHQNSSAVKRAYKPDETFNLVLPAECTLVRYQIITPVGKWDFVR